MLNLLTRSAHWLDLWLHKRLGRPYEAILTLGLVLSIGASATTLSGTVAAGGAGLQGDLFKIGGVVIFQAALLINQLAQLDEHRARRRRRKLRQAEKDGAAAAGSGRSEAGPQPDQKTAL